MSSSTVEPPKPTGPCQHRTVIKNKTTGQARCYHCGKFLANSLLVKGQSRMESFFVDIPDDNPLGIDKDKVHGEE